MQIDNDCFLYKTFPTRFYFILQSYDPPVVPLPGAETINPPFPNGFVAVPHFDVIKPNLQDL